MSVGLFVRPNLLDVFVVVDVDAPEGRRTAGSNTQHISQNPIKSANQNAASEQQN
jgi:hypothetical protein